MGLGLDRIVSVCIARDLPTAAIGVREMLVRLQPRQYLYAVPKADMPTFRNAMPSAIDIVDEREFMEGWDLKKVHSVLPPPVSWRAGWYLQQFVKINASRLSGTTLIWDADTVPLRNLTVGDSQTRISLYSGNEYHAPYFKTINALLGLERISRRSFIAQCMHVKSTWTNGLVEEIQNRSGRHWIEAVLSTLPGNHPCEFSEYETIGTFVAHYHPDEAVFNNVRWSRFGNRLIADPSDLTPSKKRYFGLIYNYIAFEPTLRNEAGARHAAELLRAVWHLAAGTMRLHRASHIHD
jgi:hypothetical protein